MSLDITEDGVLVGGSLEFAPHGDEVPLCNSSKQVSPTATHAADQLAVLPGSGPRRNRTEDFRTRDPPRESEPLRLFERDSTRLNRGVRCLASMPSFEGANYPVLRGGAEAPPDKESLNPMEEWDGLRQVVFVKGWDLLIIEPLWRKATVQTYRRRAARGWAIPDKELIQILTEEIKPHILPRYFLRKAEEQVRRTEREEARAERVVRKLEAEIAGAQKVSIAQKRAQVKALLAKKRALAVAKGLQAEIRSRAFHSRLEAARRAKKLAELEPELKAEVEEWDNWQKTLHESAVGELYQVLRDFTVKDSSGAPVRGQEQDTRRSANKGGPPGQERQRRCLIM